MDTGKANGLEDDGLECLEIFGVVLKCFRNGTSVFLKRSESDALVFQNLISVDNTIKLC